MKTYTGSVCITKENARSWEEKLRDTEIIDGDVVAYQGASITLPVVKQTGYVRAYRGASITLPEEAKIANSELRQKLREDLQKEFLEEGYFSADGILSKFVSRKKIKQIMTYTVRHLATNKIQYIVQRDDMFSHGDTVKQAIHDLRYKLNDRDTSKYKGWTLDSVHPIADVIGAYRAITGACEAGTKMWCEGQTLPEKISVRAAIEKTKGAYQAQAFAAFFKK